MANYTDTLDIVRVSGIGVEVFDETLGTGDGTTTSYDLANGNVITGSYVINYGVSGSNSLTPLVVSTDYTLDVDSGRVLLTSAGITKVNAKVIYASYIHSPKASDTWLNSFIASAMEEVNALTGNNWDTTTSYTEYFDGYDTQYPKTDEKPYGYDLTTSPEFELKRKGIVSITSVEFLDYEGNVSSSPTADMIQFETSGRVILNGASVPNGKKNVKIVYTQGYSSIPALVKELTSTLIAIKVFASITGGSYDDATMFTLGRKTISIGEVYVNVREAVNQFRNRMNEILDVLGRNYYCA